MRVAIAVALVLSGCTQTLDAGSTRPRGLLPVDARNPIVLVNDGFIDNWQGEYAVLLSNAGGPKLAGIVVNTNKDWQDLAVNVAGWRKLVADATASGLADIPDPISSVNPPLVRPANGDIDATEGNRSEGARFIANESRKLGLPYRPLVVVTGGALTDVADAYLYDKTVVDRVVVVSSLGLPTGSGGGMSLPNGDADPWADAIVVSRFRYIQVSAYYEQKLDVPEARFAELPNNAMGARIAAKQPGLFSWPPASDQVGVLAVGIPEFVTGVERVTPAAPPPAGATAGPELATDAAGSGWLVTECDGAAATARFWDLLHALPSSVEP